MAHYANLWDVWILGNTWNGNFWQVRFMFYFRRAAMHAFPFHITMGNDGTQQHHDHEQLLSLLRPLQAILSYYIY
jgi:hypothetical protein